MTDPCWLPSAIMQTTTALLGLYGVVYALMIEKVRIVKYARLGVWLFTGFNLFFISFLGISIATLCLNVLWLDSLSVNVLKLEFSEIGALAILSFFIALLTMFGYTVTMILMLLMLRKIDTFFSKLLDKAKKAPQDLTNKEIVLLIYIGTSEETLKELGIEIGDKKKFTSKQKKMAANKE